MVIPGEPISLLGQRVNGQFWNRFGMIYPGGQSNQGQIYKRNYRYLYDVCHQEASKWPLGTVFPRELPWGGGWRTTIPPCQGKCVAEKLNPSSLKTFHESL